MQKAPRLSGVEQVPRNPITRMASGIRSAIAKAMDRFQPALATPNGMPVPVENDTRSNNLYRASAKAPAAVSKRVSNAPEPKPAKIGKPRLVRNRKTGMLEPAKSLKKQPKTPVQARVQPSASGNPESNGPHLSFYAPLETSFWSTQKLVRSVKERKEPVRPARPSRIEKKASSMDKLRGWIGKKRDSIASLFKKKEMTEIGFQVRVNQVQQMRRPDPKMFQELRVAVQANAEFAKLIPERARGELAGIRQLAIKPQVPAQQNKVKVVVPEPAVSTPVPAAKQESSAKPKEAEKPAGLHPSLQRAKDNVISHYDTGVTPEALGLPAKPPKRDTLAPAPGTWGMEFDDEKTQPEIDATKIMKYMAEKAQQKAEAASEARKEKAGNPMSINPSVRPGKDPEAELLANFENAFQPDSEPSPLEEALHKAFDQAFYDDAA